MTEARVGTHGAVAVTRAADDAAPLCAALRAEGLEPLEAPLLELSYVDPGALSERLRQREAYDWLVFTSRHAVEALRRALDDRRPADGSSIAHARVGAVGPATAEALRTLSLRADVMPSEADASHLADALLNAGAGEGTRILFPRARDARLELPLALRARGVVLDDVVAYETVPSPDGAQCLTDALLAGRVAVVTFASGSAARAFATLVPPEARAHARLVSIGPTTTAVAQSCALAVAGEATEASLNALARAAHRLVHETFTHA